MKVELLSTYGDDNVIVEVARVSYNKLANQYTQEQNNKLIKYLAEHKHTSPFRHCQIQFRIECPIYVERQLFKHQVGVSVNSISGRYVDFSDTYTRIKEWRKQSTNSKQGSEGLVESQEDASYIQDIIIEACSNAYSKLIELGVSKEQARTILPLNLNTTFIWTGSLLAFVHMCHLRLKPDAQEETRLLVAEMLQQLKDSNKFEQSLKVFNL